MMLSRLSKSSKIKNILIVSMTNIGDVILTCPVIDLLKRDFPQAKMDIVVGPKAVSLFEGNPNFRIKKFNKLGPLKEKLAWFLDLKRERYDCVIDLRRTALALFLAPRYKTPIFLGKFFNGHKKDGHLNRLAQIYNFEKTSPPLLAVITNEEDKKLFENEIAGYVQGKEFVIMAPGAADSTKRWHPKGFAQVADHLSDIYKVVLVGDGNDVKIIQEIQSQMKSSSLSMAGRINLRQLAYLLKKCSWALTHDSGVMHLASYLNVPVVVLWGPTDLNKYAPWGLKSVVVKKNEKCPRCLDPKGDLKHNCMSLIEIKDVIMAAQKIKT